MTDVEFPDADLPTLPRAMIKHLAAAILSCTFTLDGSAAPQAAPGDVVSLEPRGGPVRALATSPTDPLLVIAEADYGLQRSTDGGVTYVPALTSSSRRGLHLIGTDAAGHAYAWIQNTFVNIGTLRVSVDGGQSWQFSALPWGVSAGGRYLSVSRAAAGHLWAEVEYSGFALYRSTNGGASWTQLPAPWSSAGSLALHPTRELEAAYLDEQGSAFWTVDGGATWRSSQTPALAGSSVVMTETHTIIGDGPNGGVWVSDDQGASWVQSLAGAERPRSIMRDHDVPGRAFCQMEDGPLLVSTDHGVSWDEIIRTADFIAEAVAAPAGAQHELRVGLRAHGVAQWDSAGQAFRFTQSGLSPLACRRVALDRADREHLVLLLGGERIVGESLDGGASWNFVPIPPITRLSRVKLDVEGRLYVGGQNGADAVLYRRLSTGMPSWEELDLSGVPGLPVQDVSDFVVGEENPDLIVVACQTGGAALRSALLVSHDRGLTWSGSTFGFSERIDSLGVLEGTDAPRIIMRALPYTLVGGAVLETRWSDDFGATYTSVGGVSSQLPALAHSRRVARRVMLGHSDIVPLHLSDNGLSTMNPVGAPARTAVLAVGSVDPDLVLRVDDGFYTPQQTLWISRDGGLTGTPLWTVPDTSSIHSVNGQLALRPDDSEVLIPHFGGLVSITIEPSIGTSICSPAVDNSLGRDARLTAHGSLSIAENHVRLHGHRLPHNAFGMFLASRTPGFVAGPGGSFGNLCLGGAIGRYTDQILSSGPLGEIDRTIDAAALAAPNGSVSATVGEAWTFQLWYRDTVSGVPGSNFTDALSLVWTQ